MKLWGIILLCMVVSAGYGQNYTNIFGKQDFRDSVKLSKYKDATGDSCLAVDANGKIVQRVKGGGGATSETPSYWIGSPIAEGNSITAGAAASDAGHQYVNLIAAAVGVDITNYAQSGSSIRNVIYRNFSNLPTSNVKNPETIMIGINDLCHGPTTQKYNKLAEGLNVVFANNFLNTFTAITDGSVTQSGSWIDLSPYVGSLSSKSYIKGLGHPIASTTAGSTLSFTTIGDNIIIGTYGLESHYDYGRWTVSVDGTVKGTYNPNGKADDWYYPPLGTFAPLMPNSFVLTGLGYGVHNIVITTLDDKEADFDYFGTLSTPANCPPIVVGHVCKANDAGYALDGGYATDNTIDSANNRIDSIVNIWKGRGYNIGIAHTETYFDKSTDLSSDGLHPNDNGHYHIARAFLSVINKFPADIGGGSALTLGDVMTNGNQAPINLDMNGQEIDNVSNIYMNGRIGIGTGSPENPIHIATSDNEQLKLECTNPNAYTQMDYKSDARQWQTGVGNSAESYFGVAGKYFIYDYNSTAMRMVIDGSGNVGIGVNSPASQLHTNGTIRHENLVQKPLDTTTYKVAVLDANGNLYKSYWQTSAGGSFVPYTGATTTLDMGANAVNAQAFKVNGTLGNGHIDMKWQSAAPSVIANSSALFANSIGSLSFINANGTTTLADSATVAGKVGTTRTISTTAPLQGGGDLSANRTLSITQATTSTNGYLSSTDWNTFNGKLSGNQTITLSGDVSGSGTTAITTTIGAAKVTNSMLAGSIDLTTKVTGLLPDANISSATNWNTAYSNRITSLTTTGSSGAATLSSNTLNIPNYTLSGLGGISTSTAAATYVPITGQSSDSTYSGTITWNGTAPTTLTTSAWRMSKANGFCTIQIYLAYTNAGATNTQLTLDLPATAPTPYAWGQGTATNTVYSSFGTWDVGATVNPTTPSQSTATLRKSASGYEIRCNSVSTLSAKYSTVTISYFY